MRAAPAENKGVEERTADLEDGLVADVVRLLEERGVPEGTWLLDIARARRALRDADSVLRRLEDAIVRAATPSELSDR